MTFADPLYLLLLLILPPLVWGRVRRYEPPSLSLPGVAGVKESQVKTASPLPLHLPFAMRIMAMALVIFALARPQTGYEEREIISKGIDIVLTLDLSSSMSSTDLRPNRLAAAKRVIADFIRGRTNDRIGLVVFAAAGYTQTPLTLDYPILLDFLENSHIGLIDDGTAIGMALATATSRIKDTDAASKIVILLTDGVNNRGAIEPVTAATMAKSLGVRVYTIGVGREGIYTQTVDDPRYGKRRVKVRTQIDEKLLKKIADETGGQYYRAEDEKGLADIYQRIDALEKTDIKTKVYSRYTDWFFWFLAPALFLVVAELLVPLTPLRSLP